MFRIFLKKKGKNKNCWKNHHLVFFRGWFTSLTIVLKKIEVATTSRVIVKRLIWSKLSCLNLDQHPPKADMKEVAWR